MPRRSIRNSTQAANPAEVNYIGAELILLVFIVYVTMVYGPIAAFLV